VANGSDLVFNSEIFHTDAPEFTVSFVMRRDLIADDGNYLLSRLLLLLTIPTDTRLPARPRLAPCV
jgi:hypothetical protein